MPPLLARLTACLNASEAAMLCGLLRSEGIEAIANDINLNTIDPFSSPALGFVTIDVRREELDRAREVLGERLRKPPADEDRDGTESDPCPACGGPLPEDDSKCPACGWTAGEEE